MPNPLLYRDSVTKEMTFEDVFLKIVDFIEKQPISSFRLMVGTDSHVHGSYTRFVSSIIIHSEGKGAWACRRISHVPRKMSNLKERMSYEVSLTEEIVYDFSDEKIEKLYELILPHESKGANLILEGHVDIGDKQKNKTRFLVDELMNRIKSTGFKPVIKPFSIASSSYADRFTK